MELDTSLRSDTPPIFSDGHALNHDCTWLDVLPSAGEVLRDYQRAQLRQLAGDIRAGSDRIIAQLPTGGGKTHLIAAVAPTSPRFQ